MRAVLKFGAISILLLLVALLGGLVYLCWGDTVRSLLIRSRITHLVSRAVLWVLGVDVKVEGGYPENFQGILVSNHVSYLDVLVIAARMPCIFITSEDVGESLFLGTICFCGGAIFVERRNGFRLQKDVRRMIEILDNGVRLVLFPEGTSTNGERVLPFKSSLFKAVTECGSVVLPLYIKYQNANGRPVDRILGESIYYYGDMEFSSHLRRLLALHSIDVKLTFLQSMPSRNVNRKELAMMAECAVRDFHQGRVSFSTSASASN